MIQPLTMTGKRRLMPGAPFVPAAALGKGVGWWLYGAALDLDFANNRAFNRSTGFNGSPNGILTYTSPSPKLVYDASGTLVYAPHNIVVNSPWAGSLVGDDFTPTGWSYVLSTGSSTAQSSLASAADNAIRIVATAAREILGFSFAVVAGEKWRFSFDFEAAADTVQWSSLFSFGGIGATVDTYNGETTNGLLFPQAVGTRNYIDFTPSSTGTITIRLGVGCSSNDTGDVTLARPMLQKLPFVGQTYVRNASTSAAFYSIPIDYNPTTHVPLGVLIEEQRTNLLTYSQDFDNAAWTKDRVTISANAIAAPDGTTTADKLVESTDNTPHRIYQSTTLTAAAYTYSVFAKAAERTWLTLRFDTGTDEYAYFDLANGALGSVHANYTASITPVGNGWYRCAITRTATAVSYFSLAGLATGNAVPVYTGNGTSGVYIWGAQTELGAFPTSYIPTVASTVTRAADQVSIATSAFAYNASTSTLVAAGRPYDATAYQSLASIETDGNNRFQFGRLSTAYWPTSIVSGAVTQASSGAVGTWAALTSKKIAAAFSSNDANWAYGGTLGVGDTSVTPPVSPTTLKVGNDQTSRYFNGHVSRVTYFPTRKTDAELQALSA